MSAGPGPPGLQDPQSGRPAAVFALLGLAYGTDTAFTESSLAESAVFKLPSLPPLFDHGPELAGSFFVVNLIDQIQALSPGVVLPQTVPDPGGPAGGPPEAVGAPRPLLPDSTHFPSGPAAPSK